MPVGLSDGTFHEDYPTMVAMSFPKDIVRVPIIKDEIPGIDPGDQGMVVDPGVMRQNKELDQIETDPKYGIGLDVSFKGSSTTSTMPLEASGKPAGEFKSEGGTLPPGNQYETKLTPEEEGKFQEWRQVNAPKDSGFDYDLRGAFKADVQPDASTGHWPDTYKKPNHPTFSDQSQYAKDRPDLAGKWDGETYYPPAYGFNPPERASGKTFGADVLDVLFGKDGNDIRPALGHFYEGVKNAFKLPGDVYAGKIDPMSRQGIERAVDLAGLMVTGPAPVAARLADGTLGSFAGVKSKTLPKDMLYKAQNMELEGVHADTIWEKTGFARGADNSWKYEINDRAADLNPAAFEMTPASAKSMTTKSTNPKGWENIEVEPWHQLKTKEYSQASNKDVAPKLKDVFNHPELYKAYPELADISVTKVPGMQLLAGIKGYYDPAIKQLAVSPGTLDQTRSIILHEIQHIIQGTEGFSTGANMQVFKTPQWQKLEEAFKANKKEITDIVHEFFPNNPKILSDLKYAILNAEHLPHAEESAAKGYGYAAENAKRIKDGLELMDQVPQLREGIERIIKGEKIVDEMGAELFKKYKSVKGEVESRNVQDRRNMTEKERSKLPPQYTEDTPKSQQIWSPFDSPALTDY